VNCYYWDRECIFSMRCLVCGKGIGPVRRLFDRKYCCDRHRRTARKLSARALRDAEDTEELEEPWLITAVPRNTDRDQSLGAGFSPVSGLLLIVVIILVVFVAPSSNRVSPTAAPQPRPFPFADQLEDLLRGAPASEFSEDFRTGLADWTEPLETKGTGSREWSWTATYARPSGLRLWRPTLEMTNYQLEFQGQIEEGAMSWAFRASDIENYYATKVILGSVGANRRAEIARYSMVDGERAGRVTLPLPFRIETGVPYQVLVRVKADRFSTTINGQVVDTWQDDRHTYGGIGFFSDPGERSLINWVRIANGPGLLDRLLSFSLLVTPRDVLLAVPD